MKANRYIDSKLPLILQKRRYCGHGGTDTPCQERSYRCLWQATIRIQISLFRLLFSSLSGKPHNIVRRTDCLLNGGPIVLSNWCDLKRMKLFAKFAHLSVIG